MSYSPFQFVAESQTVHSEWQQHLSQTQNQSSESVSEIPSFLLQSVENDPIPVDHAIFAPTFSSANFDSSVSNHLEYHYFPTEVDQSKPTMYDFSYATTFSYQSMLFQSPEMYTDNDDDEEQTTDGSSSTPKHLTESPQLNQSTSPSAPLHDSWLSTPPWDNESKVKSPFKHKINDLMRANKRILTNINKFPQSGKSSLKLSPTPEPVSRCILFPLSKLTFHQFEINKSMFSFPQCALTNLPNDLWYQRHQQNRIFLDPLQLPLVSKQLLALSKCFSKVAIKIDQLQDQMRKSNTRDCFSSHEFYQLCVKSIFSSLSDSFNIDPKSMTLSLFEMSKIKDPSKLEYSSQSPKQIFQTDCLTSPTAFSFDKSPYSILVLDMGSPLFDDNTQLVINAASSALERGEKHTHRKGLSPFLNSFFLFSLLTSESYISDSPDSPDSPQASQSPQQNKKTLHLLNRLYATLHQRVYKRTYKTKSLISDSARSLENLFFYSCGQNLMPQTRNYQISVLTLYLLMRSGILLFPIPTCHSRRQASLFYESVPSRLEEYSQRLLAQLSTRSKTEMDTLSSPKRKRSKQRGCRSNSLRLQLLKLQQSTTMKGKKTVCHSSKLEEKAVTTPNRLNEPIQSKNQNQGCSNDNVVEESFVSKTLSRWLRKLSI